MKRKGDGSWKIEVGVISALRPPSPISHLLSPTMNRNRNIGRGDLANQGLILQSRTIEISKSESGLLQTTLVFHLRDDQYAVCDPPRRTICPNFNPGSNRTAEALRALPYLAAQTSNFKRSAIAPPGRNGEPGIGLLEVLCQGAIFPGNQSVEEVPIHDGGQGYASRPTVTIAGGSSITDATADTYLGVESYEVDDGGTGYADGDLLETSGGTAAITAKISVITAGTGGSIDPADGAELRVTTPGAYSALPSNPVSLTGGSGSGAQINVTSWALALIVVSNGGEYPPSGQPTATISGGSPDTAATLELPIMGPRFGDVITEPYDLITTVKDTVEITVYEDNSPEPRYLATIDYRAIELSYEYCATLRSPEPRFIFNEYTMDGDGNIITNPANGERFRLRIISVAAFAAVNTIVFSQDGNDQTGGSLVSGKKYRLTNYIAGDDFSNVGSTNTQGEIFTASGTTPTDWTHGSLLTEVGSDLTTGPLVAGNAYRISVYGVGDDFSNLGSTNIQGEVFIATGTTPTVWANGSVLTEMFQRVGETKQGPQVGITSAVWHAAVKFIGDASQFTQVPAGYAYHVTETCTVKIVGNPPSSGVIPPDSRFAGVPPPSRRYRDI